jgi:hypothetical protein
MFVKAVFPVAAGGGGYTVARVRPPEVAAIKGGKEKTPACRPAGRLSETLMAAGVRVVSGMIVLDVAGRTG